MGKPKNNDGDYIHVGDVLRDALVDDIDSIAWEGPDVERAAKVKTALQLAAPRRGGYLLDMNGWTAADIDFLRIALDSVYEDEGHSFMSHGVALGNTRIGRQIRALREKI